MRTKFIPRCTACPDLGAHVHHNNKVEAIEDGKDGLHLIEFEVAAVEFGYCLKSEGY